jgi:hypothetical protein
LFSVAKIHISANYKLTLNSFAWRNFKPNLMLKKTDLNGAFYFLNKKAVCSLASLVAFWLTFYLLKIKKILYGMVAPLTFQGNSVGYSL